MYLLDTNVIGALAHDPRGPVTRRIETVTSDDFCINPIIACEIEYGVIKRGSARLRHHIDAILSAIPIVDLPSDIATQYGQIRTDLEARGTPIGPNDLLIAAHGVAAEMTVVTANEREFRRVRQLSVENWLTPPAERS